LEKKKGQYLSNRIVGWGAKQRGFEEKKKKPCPAGQRDGTSFERGEKRFRGKGEKRGRKALVRGYLSMRKRGQIFISKPSPRGRGHGGGFGKVVL